MPESRGASSIGASATPAQDSHDDIAHVAEMIGCAEQAKELAGRLGEKFLAYLLAMVIQEMSDVKLRRTARREATSTRTGDAPDATGERR